MISLEITFQPNAISVARCVLSDDSGLVFGIYKPKSPSTHEILLTTNIHYCLLFFHSRSAVIPNLSILPRHTAFQYLSNLIIPYPDTDMRNGHIMIICINIEHRNLETRKHLRLLSSGMKLFITFEFKGSST